jgi:5-methylcytosine-specific restriction protein A
VARARGSPAGLRTDMPTPQRPCNQPGCGALVASGRWCAAHQRKAPRSVYDQTTRKDVPALAMAAQIRNGATWQRFRAWFRAKHPLCCDPLWEHREWPKPMAHVHHIEPLSARPDLAYTESNCAPLCTRCHAKIEGMERNGVATANLFIQQCKDVAISHQPDS